MGIGGGGGAGMMDDVVPIARDRLPDVCLGVEGWLLENGRELRL
jgi:hypothetical protein